MMFRARTINGQVSRRGAISNAATVVLASVAAMGLLILLLAWNTGPTVTSANSLLVYCAASQKTPLTEIAQRYQHQSGVAVQLQFGGSQTLLTNAQLSGRGDLFLPADDSYLELARQKELVGKTWPLARMHVLLAVRDGNPLEIHSVADLVEKGAKLSLPNPDAAAIGKLVRQSLIESGQWPAVESLVVVFKPTVTDSANDVKLGTVDAAFIWDCMREQYSDLELIEVPALESVEAQIAVGLLTSSRQQAAAERFASYLASRDGGLQVFRDHGYQIVDEEPLSGGN